MSYQADLLNAYRDQLAKIKAAFESLEFEECYAVHGLKELDAAINDPEVFELEHMYDFKGPAIILPDGPSNSRENVAGVKEDGSTYTIEITGVSKGKPSAFREDQVEYDIRDLDDENPQA